MANAAPDMNALVSASRSWVRRSLTQPAPAAWTLAALGGCLAELSGAGPAPALTLAFGLVREAQRRGEPAAWISRTESTFFPPDAAAGGVDLAALPVILLDDVRHRLRAADRLARSGAFGLLVVDLGDRLDLPLACGHASTSCPLAVKTSSVFSATSPVAPSMLLITFCEMVGVAHRNSPVARSSV